MRFALTSSLGLFAETLSVRVCSGSEGANHRMLGHTAFPVWLHEIDPRSNCSQVAPSGVVGGA